MVRLWNYLARVRRNLGVSGPSTWCSGYRTHIETTLDRIKKLVKPHAHAERRDGLRVWLVDAARCLSKEAHDALNPWEQYGLRDLLYTFYNALETLINQGNYNDAFRCLVSSTFVNGCERV